MPDGNPLFLCLLIENYGGEKATKTAKIAENVAVASAKRQF